MRLNIYAGMMVLIFLLGGCSSAKLTNTWKKEGYSGKPESILIVGVSGSQSHRQNFELSISKALKKQGVKATPSYTVFTHKDLNKEAVVDYAKKEKIEAIIVTKVLDSKSLSQRTTHVTGSSLRNPYYRSFNGWYDDYVYANHSIVTYETNVRVSNLETNLYLLEEKDLVWSVLSQVSTHNNGSSGVDDLVSQLIKQLKKEKLI